MLNEPASSRDDRPILRAPVQDEGPEEYLILTLRGMVAEVLDIHSEHYLRDDDSVAGTMPGVPVQLTARFTGQLRIESERAYDILDKQFTKLDHIPIFRQEEGKHVIMALQGRINPQPRPWWPNLLLFLATVVSVLIVGTQLAIMEIANANPFRGMLLQNRFFSEIWRGLPYAAGILLILGAHELGHYFAARRHKLAVTLPYFIPLPLFSPFGTMGAFIQLRQPMRNRKVLLDVGAAGPLAGLLFAVPILFIGLASARIGPIMPGSVYEGDSVLYAFAKLVTFGQFLPANGIDVYIDSSQLAWAGWTGLLVSALNLIPIGQLDGGHILYALIGERARRLYFPILAIMVALVFVANVWMFWVILLLLFGRVYATPLDMITPLDQRRRWIGVAALVIFLFIFVPLPMARSTGNAESAPRGTVELQLSHTPAAEVASISGR